MLGQENEDAGHAFDRTLITADKGLVEASYDRWRWRADLRLVLFGETQVDGCEIHTVLQLFLLGFPLLDSEANAVVFG